MENCEQVKKNRIFAFDFMRVISILAVILIHVTSQFITKFQNNTFEYVLGCVLNSVARFGAPLFFMISGALMLNEDKPLTFKGCLLRAFRVFLLLCFWSMFYALIKEIGFPLIEGNPVVFKSFIYAFIYGNYHLWFLYVLIGLYLITPILRFITKKENMKFIMYFLALCVIFVFVPSIVTGVLNFYDQPGILGFLGQFKIAVVGTYTGYYVLGYYLFNKEIDKRHRIIVYFFGGVSLIITILGALFINYDIFFSYSNVTVFLYSMAVFILIKQLSKDKVSQFRLTLFSRLTFGVYVLHAFVLSIVFRYLPYFNMPYVSVPLIFTIVTVISYGVCLVISKIPYINKLIKY